MDKEELLLKTYMDKDYFNEKKNHFSIKALLLGPLYLIYNNIILKGLLYLLFLSILCFINKELTLLTYIIINLYLSFNFNTIYLNHCSNKVDEIQLTNPQKTENELLALCKKKGNKKKNIILIFIILISILAEIILNNPIKKETIQKPIKESIGSLSYEVPKFFIPGKQNSNAYKHYYYINDKNNCSITITINKEKGNLSINEQINNNIWQKEITKEKENMVNIYQININNKTYQVIYKEKKGENCKNLKKQFLKTLQIDKNI